MLKALSFGTSLGSHEAWWSAHLKHKYLWATLFAWWNACRVSWNFKIVCFSYWKEIRFIPWALVVCLSPKFQSGLQMLVITIRLNICGQIMQLIMRSVDLLLCQFLILLRCHAVLFWNSSLPKRSPILMQSWKLFAMRSRLVSLFLFFTARIFF